MIDPRPLLITTLVLAAAPLASAQPAVAPRSGVRIDWDAYGVPHVAGATDEDAFFGLGYAVAHDRLFQMHYTRLIYEGRTAEFFGAGPNDANLIQDRRARQIGWTRHADKVVRALDPETRGLLQAYADGVNAAVARRHATQPAWAPGSASPATSPASPTTRPRPCTRWRT
jgi:penicillin amidase